MGEPLYLRDRLLSQPIEIRYSKPFGERLSESLNNFIQLQLKCYCYKHQYLVQYSESLSSVQPMPLTRFNLTIWDAILYVC